MSQDFSRLEKAILQTLAFFDVFDYPLTLVEIHKWLYRPDRRYQLSEILQALAGDNLKVKVQSSNGFYFLNNRHSIVRIRLDRYNIAEKKFKIALKATRFLRWIAFVRMIAICNNVGYNNGSKDSDIDFFIIVRQGRLWWSRLVITLVTTFLGIRRHGTKVVDRVCLSFYTATDHLNLSDISLKPIDPYLVYWFATLAPIYNRHKTYEIFLQSNIWLKDYLPNLYETLPSKRRFVEDRPYINALRKVDNAILSTKAGDMMEKISRALELKKIKNYFGSSMTQDNTNVIMSSSMLKLHKIDRRDKYKNMWQDKLNKLGL